MFFTNKDYKIYSKLKKKPSNIDIDIRDYVNICFEQNYKLKTENLKKKIKFSKSNTGRHKRSPKIYEDHTSNFIFSCYCVFNW